MAQSRMLFTLKFNNTEKQSVFNTLQVSKSGIRTAIEKASSILSGKSTLSKEEALKILNDNDEAHVESSDGRNSIDVYFWVET